MITGDITFTMIKPDALAAGYSGPIVDRIEKAGFRILTMKLTRLTREQAGQFYAVHKDKTFYNDLCEYMSSGKIIAMVLQKNNAIDEFRKLIGATNPSAAAEGTLRKLYGKSIQSNAIHGSDSDENALIEAGFFFSKLEYFTG